MSDLRLSVPIEGVEITGWSGLQVVRAIDACADAFAFSVPWEDTPKNRRVFAAYRNARCIVTIDGEQVIVGRMESIGASYGPNERTVEIQGRGYSGVLADWSAGPPFEWANGTLFNDIAWSICVAQSTDGRVDPALARVAVTAVPPIINGQRQPPLQIPIASIENPGTTVWEFLRGIAAAHNYFAVPQPGGSLTFTQFSSNPRPVAELAEGRAPLISINTVHDSTKRFYEYFVMQDADATFSEAVAIDRGVDVDIRSRKFITPSIESWDLQEAANHARSRGVIDSYQCNAVVQGWRHNLGLWKPGDAVSIFAPSAFIFNVSTLMVVRATLQLDENGGEVTALDLALPDMYSANPDLRANRNYPWSIGERL